MRPPWSSCTRLWFFNFNVLDFDLDFVLAFVFIGLFSIPLQITVTIPVIAVAFIISESPVSATITIIGYYCFDIFTANWITFIPRLDLSSQS